MSFTLSQHPGPNERQLKRKLNNPLFDYTNEINQSTIDRARQADSAAFDKFLSEFQTLVQEAVNLEANSDSEVILNLKERLDKSFTLCCALPGENTEIKDAINKLLRVIMAAVRKGAANDPLALEKLDEEDIARNIHQKLQTNLLVVDLMLDDSPIESNELTATLLNESEANLQEALTLFDPEQLTLIFTDARNNLETLSSRGINFAIGNKNLVLIEAAMLNNLSDKND